MVFVHGEIDFHNFYLIFTFAQFYSYFYFFNVFLVLQSVLLS